MIVWRSVVVIKSHGFEGAEEVDAAAVVDGMALCAAVVEVEGEDEEEEDPQAERLNPKETTAGTRKMALRMVISIRWRAGLNQKR